MLEKPPPKWHPETLQDTNILDSRHFDKAELIKPLDLNA